MAYWPCQPYDVSQTWMAGVPLATLQVWLQQCQLSRFQVGAGTKAVTLSYAQGDGNKSVSMQITSQAAMENTIAQLNMALGNTVRARQPIKLLF